MPENSISQPPIYELGPDFFDEVAASSFPEGILRYRNDKAAAEVSLQQLSDEDWKKHFWAFEALPGNIKKPLALRYHGHQFGSYNPELGDGRGFLFAQFFHGGRLLDLGTKGSGQTPYSRSGDGRLTLKGAFREVLCTEYLESLGVNTSRSFSVFETGESLIRHDEPSPTRAAVLVRLSHSHIRIGTFQRLLYLGQIENIKKLTSFCIRNYYPEFLSMDPEKGAEAFFREVVRRHAHLVASYMIAGFVHGVLNTDNLNITGESFDYGPYRFLPVYDPSFTAAYFDNSGFYAFGRQPASFMWNLQQLGRTLLAAFPQLSVSELLDHFSEDFNHEIQNRFLTRLNLKPKSSEDNEQLLRLFFELMSKKEIPFEQGFFDLFGGWNSERLNKSPYAKNYSTASNLKLALRSFEPAQPKLIQRPYFAKLQPETLLIDEIENLWDPIEQDDNWDGFYQKIQSIRDMRGLYKSNEPTPPPL